MMKYLIQILVIFVILQQPLQAQQLMPQVTKGTIKHIPLLESSLIDPRPIFVWLPPGYSKSNQYEVLYMHDGQMLFDANTTWNKQAWEIDDIAGALIEQGKLRPFIVVGIPNNGAKRHSEFFPQQPFENMTPEQQNALYQAERSADLPLFATKVYSDNYLAFIVTELAPYIESHFSVKKGGANRYIGGSSMGGLISWYGLLQYPSEFAGAICMSTHWPGGFEANGASFPAFYDFIAEKLPILRSQKVYFDYGDATLDAMYPPLQKQIDNLFQSASYPESQWQSRYFPGENHSEEAWAKRLHLPLTFLFGRSES